MKLAIFDIDGTLLDNHASEDACYVRALRDALGLERVNCDWSVYRDVSDDGVTQEAYLAHFGVPLSTERRDAAIGRFVELLGEAAGTGGIPCVRGAQGLFESLGENGWAVCLATGAWHRAATFKLAAAGLRYQAVPLATSEDGPSRLDIVSTARSRAEQRYRVAFDRVVSIGDGVWDVETARRLELPFVGVGRADRRTLLRDHGASVVIEDFSDFAATLEALTAASRPVAR